MMLRGWLVANSPGGAAASVTLTGGEQLAALCSHLGEALQVRAHDPRTPHRLIVTIQPALVVEWMHVLRGAESPAEPAA
jgi:hypothetical protein